MSGGCVSCGEFSQIALNSLLFWLTFLCISVPFFSGILPDMIDFRPHALCLSVSASRPLRAQAKRTVRTLLFLLWCWQEKHGTMQVWALWPRSTAFPAAQRQYCCRSSVQQYQIIFPPIRRKPKLWLLWAKFITVTNENNGSASCQVSYVILTERISSFQSVVGEPYSACI